jgi:MFS family permease
LTAAVLALQRRTFRSLRGHRNYRLFFAGQVVSLSGTWMQNIALAWLVLQLSGGSALAVGALAFCRFLPFTILGLLAGAVVDRLDARRLVMATQAAAMGVSGLLAAAVFSGAATLPLVFALATLGGIAFVFDAPGRQALTFQMVGPKALPNAVALNSGLFNASRVFGPAIAGLIIAGAGVGACFALNSVSFLAILASLALMRSGELVPLEKDRSRSVLRGIRDGVSYAYHSPELRTALVVVLVASTVGFNFNVLLPLLSSQTLHAGATTFGALSAVFGLGALMGAISSATVGRASWRGFLVGAGGFSVGLLALAPVRTAWVAGCVLFAVGASFTLFTSNANAIVQLASPEHLRGRLVALYLFAFAGLAPVGGLLAGWLAHLGGTPLAFTVAGLTGIATALVAGQARRKRSKLALAEQA